MALEPVEREPAEVLQHAGVREEMLARVGDLRPG
jgi:hypothetical protein